MENVILKDSPLIVTDFISGRFSYLIIDGNHRIKYWKQNNNEIAQFVYVVEKDMIKENYFVSELDKYLYILNNEIRTLIDFKINGLNETELFSKSFIQTNNVLDVESFNI